jgi:hypothetical protein
MTEFLDLQRGGIPGVEILLLTVGLVWSTNTSAGENLSFLPDRGDANLTFYLDNDLFANTDEDYTNGARLSWISGSRDPNEFGPVQRNLQRLSSDPEGRTWFRRLSGFQDPEQLEYNYGFSLTQLMFTPEDEEPPVAPPGQRPYAGWLGIDLSLHIKDAHALNSVSLAIGTTGPNSYAKEAQDLVHNIRGQQEFDGWDSQVPNEVTANFYTSQRRRVVIRDPSQGSFAIDGFTEARLALGTFLTSVSAGTLIRFGWNLPTDFADARLSTTSYLLVSVRLDRFSGCRHRAQHHPGWPGVSQLQYRHQLETLRWRSLHWFRSALPWSQLQLCTHLPVHGIQGAG